MSEDNIYQDADIVWVKLGTSWWPGEVCGQQRQPEGFLQLAKRKPYCVVKFFQEDSFEYVKSSKHILPFNCSKKDEFIRKGHELFKAKKKFMEKFPSDVSTAERLTRSVTRSSLFFNSRPDSIVKAILGKSPSQNDPIRNGVRCDHVTKIINITPNRNSGGSRSCNSPPTYKCGICDFQSTRQNVMVLHRKSHSSKPPTISRNSLVNSSTMTLPSQSEPEKRCVTKTVSVATSPPPSEIIVWETAVSTPIKSLLSNDTAVVISDESDNSSEANTLDPKKSTISVTMPEGYLSSEQNNFITLVHDSPIHKKSGKGKLRKSEEIQKSLLADWIDEDKDDDEEEDNQNTKEDQMAHVYEAIPKANQNLNNFSASSLTAASFVQIKKVETVDQYENNIGPYIQKPSTKIRNIPKKDRRNIVFTDFNIGDEPINVDALSQQSNEDVCQEGRSTEEISSFSDKTSATKLSTAEPSSEEAPSEEASGIEPCAIEVLNEDTFLAGSLAVEASKVKFSTSEAAEEKPSTGGPFSAILKSSITESVNEESSTAKPSPEKLSTPEPCFEKLSAINSSIMKPTTITQSVISHSIMESAAIKELSVQSSDESLFTLEFCRKGLSNMKTTALEQPTAEATTTEESAALKISTLKCPPTASLTVESSSVDLPSVKLSKKEPCVVISHAENQGSIKESVFKPSTEESIIVEPYTMEQISVKVSTSEKSIEENFKPESYSVKSPAVDSLQVKSSTATLKPSFGELYTTEISNPQLSTMKPHIVDSSAVEITIENQPAIEPIAEKLTIIETNEALSIVESSTERAPASHPYPAESSTEESPADELFPAESSTEEAPTNSSTDAPGELSTVELDTVKQSMGKPSTLGSAAAEPYYMEPPTALSKEEPSQTSSVLEPQKASTTELSTERSSGEKMSIIDSHREEVCTMELAESTVEEVSSMETSSTKTFDDEPTISEFSNIVGAQELNTQKELDVTESKTNCVSKGSLSCFDFEEEEDTDILTSIAKFKKKYISPEKNHEFAKDILPKTPDHQKRDLDLKDKQLSADIESLLKTTELPVELAAPSSFIERSISHEVRGLPIKERGKRIFKSRNRFRAESCSSVSSTATAKVLTESLHASKEFDNKITSLPITRSVEKSYDAAKKDHIDEISSSPTQVNIDETSLNMPHPQKDESMDDKVTNSEEEIVGRVVYSPAEVYAPKADFFLTESPDNVEDHVSSSGMEVHTESPCASEENMKEEIVESQLNYTQVSENADSCDIDEDNQISESSPRVEGIVEIDETQQLQSDIFQQDMQQQDELSTFFVVETNEPIYEVEIYDESESNKQSDLDYEINNEYELISTEVTNIVDRISSEEVVKLSAENVEENSPQGPVEEVSEMVTCSNDNQLQFSETNYTVIESQDCSMPDDVEGDNTYLGLKDLKPSEFDGDNPSDGSDSFLAVEMQLKGSDPYKDTRVEVLEDESIQTGVEPEEMSSDDTSTVISEAEAEFGSPTSMLEEERVLNRGRSECETPATNTEYPNNIPKTRRSITRRTQVHSQSCRKETQGSASNDLDQNSPIFDYYEEVHENGNMDKKEGTISEAFLPKENDTLDESENLITENYQENPDKEENISLIEEDVLDTNTESDSAEDDEEEISSPPIESLQDESREVETIRPCSTTNILLELQNECRVESKYAVHSSDINDQPTEKDSIELSTNTQSENNQLIGSQSQPQVYNGLSDIISENSIQGILDQSDVTQNESAISSIGADVSNAYYTVTQKTDTIIKLNKYIEGSEQTKSSNQWSETNADDEKSEIACEELSAAEALLLIPNQTSNLLDNLHGLPKTSESSSADENHTPLMVDQEIKVETLESTESNLHSSEPKSYEDSQKEVVRRKRRSHMKVTPRKRVIDVQKSGKQETDLVNIGAKIPKLTQDSKPSGSIFLNKNQVEPNKRSFEEQYEDNFVVQYLKEHSVESMDLVEIAKCTTTDLAKSPNSGEKSTPEKVHITVDISNPLSSQIASILGTHRPPATEVTSHGGAKKRKQTVEDDIPSFIIKRPSPKTVAEAEAADRDTIAQIQNLCPHVEITRKSSKDDQSISTAPLQQSIKPQIINQQILRPGTNQPIITVTAKSKKSEEGVFDISNMPIVLSNEAIMNEKLHLVITPTTNPQVIKQFQNQQQLVLNPGTSTSPQNIPTPGIPIRRPSNVRTKRTPSRQQLQEQQNQEQQNLQLQQQNQQEEHQQHNKKLQQNHNHQHQYHQQHQQVQLHQHQQQQQQHHQQHQQQQHHQQHHQQQQHQRQHQQVQLQHQHNFQQQQHYQQQFQLHHQNQIQQQLQEEQQILIQQHQQQFLLQQQQLQQHHLQQQQVQQQQLQMQQHLISSEKVCQSVDKQMGVDTRGNKYVIIKAPPNTVVVGNNSDPNKGMQRLQQQEIADIRNTNKQRKQCQSASSNQKAVSHPLQIPLQSQLPQIPILPVQSPPPNQIYSSPAQIREAHSNVIQPHFEEAQLAPGMPTTLAKAKGSGRGRRSKQPNKMEAAPSAKENVGKNARNNANGKRSSGSICDPPRQRSTRSSAANKKNSPMTSCSEMQQSVVNDFIPSPMYTTTQQQAQSVVFMANPQANTPSSLPVISTNNMPFQVQQSSLSPCMMSQVIPGIPIETINGSGVGYAVPSLPVPGYPQTFLLCELIDKKYKEVSSKPLYLSQDRTRFFEVPDELVTEAHRRLTDCRREPNPDVLEVVSGGVPHVLQPRAVEINPETMVGHIQQEQASNQGLMQEHERLSVEEQASALMCLQEQIVQEQIVQEQLVQEQLAQNQLSQEQLVQEQLVQEQLVQEQLVQEQLVQEQLVQEQLVQEQLAQEQFVQEQFMQQQHTEEQGLLQVARIETVEAQNSIKDGQTTTVVLSAGNEQVILPEEVFLTMLGTHDIEIMSAEKDAYILSPETIHRLMHTVRVGKNMTPGIEFDGEVCQQQQFIMNENMLQNEDTSPDILTVALDDSELYSGEQFINSGEILQIETSEGLHIIGTAGGVNGDIVFHPMTTTMSAKTSETNVLLNQAPKMSITEITSDKSKPNFDSDPSTTTSLEDCLHVIGVPAQSPIGSLELPTSVTNPAIVTETRTPTPGTITMNEIIVTGLCHHPDITSLPPMGSNEQELHYEFFPSDAGTHNDEVHVSEESVVADMGEYAVVSTGGSFDDPGR